MKCSEVRWNREVGNLNGFKPNERVVKCSWVKLERKCSVEKCSEVESSVAGWSVVKRSEGLTNRVCNIFINYIDHVKFAAYMAVSFITFFLILLVPCFYHCTYGCVFCMPLFDFVNYVFFHYYVYVFLLLNMFRSG